MENVQKTRRLFASAYGCKASRSFLIWGLSAAMSISVIPMMAEISVGEKNYDTQIVSQTKTITGTIIDETFLSDDFLFCQWPISPGSDQRDPGGYSGLGDFHRDG